MRCRNCPATHAITATPLTDLDAAFRELHAVGWLDMAWKGRGRERWDWACPACRPRGSMATAPRVEQPLPKPGPLERMNGPGPPVICDLTRAITERCAGVGLYGRLGLSDRVERTSPCQRSGSTS